MEDKEYNKIKELVEKDTDPNFEMGVSDWRWDVGMLHLFKDSKSKKDFVRFINITKRDLFANIIHSCLNVISKEYIKIESIPSSKDILGIIEDRIKSNKSMIIFCKKELVKHMKLKDKETDYDKRRGMELDIYSDKSSMEGYQSEIYKYEHLRDCIKNDIRSMVRKKTSNVNKANEGGKTNER